jgi:hypothetical protein
VFTIYSAGIGQTALDRLDNADRDRNSVFTRVFSKKLRESGRPLTEIMEDVKEEVATLAANVVDPETRLPHSQFPAYYNETRGGRIFLAGRTTPEAAPSPVTPPPPPSADEIAWSFIETTNDVRQIESFLARFPDSRRRPLAEARLGELRRRAHETAAPAARPPAPPPLARDQTAVLTPPPVPPPPAPMGGTPDLAAVLGPAPATVARKGPVLTLVKKSTIGRPGEGFAQSAIANVEIAREPAKHGVPAGVLASRPSKIRKLASGWITLTADQTATFYDLQGRAAGSIALAKYFDTSPVRDGTLSFNRSVDDLFAAGTTLFFNVSCANTYAKTFKGKCGYMAAVDLPTQKMLWRSDDLTSTGRFVLSSGVLITGYGFTDEKDYIFALDTATGKTLQRVVVDSSPDAMELVGNQFRAVSYGNILYEFRIN